MHQNLCIESTLGMKEKYYSFLCYYPKSHVFSTNTLWISINLSPKNEISVFKRISRSNKISDESYYLKIQVTYLVGITRDDNIQTGFRPSQNKTNFPFFQQKKRIITESIKHIPLKMEQMNLTVLDVFWNLKQMRVEVG